MCWPWPFIWKIFLKNTILFFFTFLPLSLCSSGDHNVIFDEKEYSPQNWFTNKLIHWRSKGTSRTGDHCSFVSSFPLEQRQIKATRRKEKKAEDCTDGAIWAQTEITSDFNSWEMRWHQRNLICVIHNRKIGRNAASDRYSIFNMTVSFRSFQFFGATLCSTATSKINLYRLRDLEI